MLLHNVVILTSCFCHLHTHFGFFFPRQYAQSIVMKSSHIAEEWAHSCDDMHQDFNAFDKRPLSVRIAAGYTNAAATVWWGQEES